jgi:hypothetical protein
MSTLPPNTPPNIPPIQPPPLPSAQDPALKFESPFPPPQAVLAAGATGMGASWLIEQALKGEDSVVLRSARWANKLPGNGALEKLNTPLARKILRETPATEIETEVVQRHTQAVLNWLAKQPASATAQEVRDTLTPVRTAAELETALNRLAEHRPHAPFKQQWTRLPEKWHQRALPLAEKLGKADWLFTLPQPVRDALNPATSWETAQDAVKALPDGNRWGEQLLKLEMTAQDHQRTALSPVYKQLKGLRRRVLDGLNNRYLPAYRMEQQLIEKNGLRPLGRLWLGSVQHLRQVLTGELTAPSGFMGRAMGPFINGFFILFSAWDGWSKAEGKDKVKAAVQEGLGPGLGNLLGWSMGLRLLSHTGWVPKVLNRLRPGLDTKPFLMGTMGGVASEILAFTLLAYPFEKAGKALAHQLVGRPSGQHTLTPGKDYVPPRQEDFWAKVAQPQAATPQTETEDPTLAALKLGPEASKYDRPKVSNLQPMTDLDLEALMANPHAVSLNQSVEDLTRKTRADRILTRKPHPEPSQPELL